MFAFPKSIKKFWCVLVVSMGLVWIPSARADYALDISSVPGASIEFTGTGDTFTFVDSSIGAFTGYDFLVVLENKSGAGPTVGLLGNISGTYTIGVITTNGAKQSAPVTGSGTITINDGMGFTFSASVDWETIQTEGTGGTINAGALFNLTTATYAGTNTTLLGMTAEINASAGIATATFQFVDPTRNLTDLTTDGTTNTTSYSGSLITQAIPAPPSLVMACAGLLTMGGGTFLRRKRRQAA